MATRRASSPYILVRLVGVWFRQSGLGTKLTVLLAIAALLAGLVTYARLTGSFGMAKAGTQEGLALLVLDIALLLALGTGIAVRLARLYAARQKGIAGSRLHARLVLLFALIAVAPAIMVSVASFLFFNFTVTATFSAPVRQALEDSVTVAEAYLKEHRQTIAADALAMANDLNRASARLLSNRSVLTEFLTAQGALRSLTEVMVVDRGGAVVAKSDFTFVYSSSVVSPLLIQRALSGDVVVLTGENEDRVRALVRLEGLLNTFLIVGRYVEPQVLAHIQSTRASAATFRRLEGEREQFEITFAAIYGVIALLILMVAILIGLTLATRLARPIVNLINAAELIRGGDLSARVPDPGGADELSSLSRAFNRMTLQLKSQQDDLIEVNTQLDERRRFTETVLSGVSAGVIGLDAEGRINLPNRASSDLLGLNLSDMIGKKLARAVPEMKGLVSAARGQPDRIVERQVSLSRNGRTNTLLVRIAADRTEEGAPVTGFVVTFDDVTDLMSAQRVAAWADVARRLAHEIKNPLTPIQLSTERLKRKFGKQIDADVEVFNTCTDTIVRHVDDIRRMVDEFSAFARMPTPVLKPENMSELAHQAVFLQRAAHPGIQFDSDLPDEALYLRCDGGKIRQVLTNLLQNAVEAIDGREAPADGGALPPGRVSLSLTTTPKSTEIMVEDNGKGLPAEGRERLTEPYVTTREKGTGLGLAVVKKIMEEHDGEVALQDADGGGARVLLTFHRAAMTGSELEASQSDTGEPAGTDERRRLRKVVGHGA